MDLFNDCGMTPGWLVGYEAPRALNASFLVKGTFRLSLGERASLSDEQEGLAGDVPEVDSDQAIRYSRDLTARKPFLDLLLVGTAHAPGGRPVTELPVSFSVGRWKKTLAVVGDRFAGKAFLGSNRSDPVPFERMPLSWSRALGGKKSSRNPAGRGLDEVTDDSGQRFVPLPNIVGVDEVSLHPKKLREPAGFGPISPDWAQRMEKARRASFDDRWLKESWPGYPRDFDLSYFNAAPPDQQLPLNALRGDEELGFGNLHPQHARYQSALPGLRVRWFTLEERGDSESFREVPLELDTLWVDLDSETLILVWRGVAPIHSKRMKEVLAHLVVSEPVSSKPLAAEHYRKLLEERRNEAEAEPEEEPPPEPEAPPPAPPRKPFDWDAWEKEFAERTAEAEKLMKAPLPGENDPSPLDHAAAFLRREGADPGILARKTPEDPDGMAALLEDHHKKIASISSGAAKLIGPPPSAGDLDAALAEKKFDEEFASYLEDEVPEPGAEEEPAEEEPPWTRETVEEHASRQGEFTNQDLAGLDLSGLKLAGLNFQGAVLEGANLSGCDLSGSDLSGAVLVQAKLSGANLAQAKLVEADLSEADLSKADLTGCQLEFATCSKASFQGARLISLRAKRAELFECDLSGAEVRECDFTDADFSRAAFPEVDFGASILRNARAYGVTGPGCNLSGCDLATFRGGEGADLTKARFSAAKAPGSIWEESRLDGADFSDADLTQASFNETSLVGACFVRANLRKARLLDANLERALLVKANLFRASFEGSNLEGADFKGACAYEVEFLDTFRDGADFRLTNLKGTKLA